MSALRFVNITVHHPGARQAQDGAESRAELALATEGGRLRLVPLGRADVVKLIRDAAKVLAILDRVDR